MKAKRLEIAGRVIGPQQPCFLMAEAGVNHNGRVELAKRLIDAAAEAGADAVKFQTFRAEALASPSAPLAAYQRRAVGTAASQLDMIRQLELPPAAYRELQAHCRVRGILFLSTPFDEDSVNLLAELNVPAFKIASGEITNWPLLQRVARHGRPMIVSTGMSSLDEVQQAVSVIRAAGNDQVVLLHCVSQYPAPACEANLRALHTMRETFGLPVGYSDHTLGADVALAAVALGACILEKHITLDRDLPGPDHKASLVPEEWKRLVRGVRTVESALGHGRKEAAPSERDTAAVARRSLVAARDIAVGKRLTEELIAIRRPGTGLPPKMRSELVGRTAKGHIPAGSLLELEMFE